MHEPSYISRKKQEHIIQISYIEHEQLLMVKVDLVLMIEMMIEVTQLYIYEIMVKMVNLQEQHVQHEHMIEVLYKSNQT